jgi:hypothetical protein
VSRPPIAVERLALIPAGQVRYQLKTPYRDGTTHIVLEPLELMARLAALVPPPRMHLSRFHGVFAPHSRLRAAVTPAHRGASSLWSPHPGARAGSNPRKSPRSERACYGQGKWRCGGATAFDVRCSFIGCDLKTIECANSPERAQSHRLRLGPKAMQRISATYEQGVTEGVPGEQRHDVAHVRVGRSSMPP